MPTGTLLTLEFRSGQRDWSISALVVHVNREGLGVLFEYLQPQLFACLRDQALDPPANTLPAPLVAGL